MGVSAMAEAALRDHMPLLQAGHHAKHYGWEVEMDWATGICHVHLSRPYGVGEGSTIHRYRLRITFDRYPVEQPGVHFVDPATGEIGPPHTFMATWPNVDGNPWINVNINANEPQKSYLCFQWTQEFRQTHAVPAESDPKRWDPKRHTVVGVVRLVQLALSSSHYKGYRTQ
jgi:hypothetical protein